VRVNDDLAEGIVRAYRFINISDEVLKKLDHSGNALWVDAILRFLQTENRLRFRIFRKDRQCQKT